MTQANEYTLVEKPVPCSLADRYGCLCIAPTEQAVPGALNITEGAPCS